MKKKTRKPADPETPKMEPAVKKDFSKAHDQAEKDIEKDPDLNAKPNREDDLDEGELARLEGEQ